MMEPADITREMIEGARIVDIHETHEVSDEGLDTRVIYFTTDRGFTFITPFAGNRWETCEVPDEAVRMEDEFVWSSCKVVRGLFGRPRFVEEPIVIDTVGQIKNRTISGVQCGPYDEELEFHDPPDGEIVFDDGSRASNNMVAPHGTGGAGLFFQGPSESSHIGVRVDFFTVPQDNNAEQGVAPQPAARSESDFLGPLPPSN